MKTDNSNDMKGRANSESVRTPGAALASCKGNLYVLVGIPGSGKSTAGARYGTVYSSDDIREKLFGDSALQFEEKAVKEYLHRIKPELRQEELDTLSEKDLIAAGNSMVFSRLNRDVKKALQRGEDVVYDATSLTPKTRKAILKKFAGLYDHTVAIFVNTDLEEAKRRNAGRERKVPDEVIEKMYSQLRAPDVSEGFDEVIEI